ncbi:MAG: YjbF family lipoprotein [Gammaproteobacteria bacterium]|nr:YjbF family lipoprotein [Gammaproteobacteria bacterium]MBU1555787.1 YjbF family lipoprotein [Gammaproteobacteria bacterium]MBU2069687.1 YjbF family lipoprotein [Gammaproteobacteria bacterium]MBU2184552.1 YjbF family lipoprotein [Gammaproteobacteria bacterium]MBU2205234.1 YjbF family lipoprotein [Gammaproteobacteria bacterium]
MNTAIKPFFAAGVLLALSACSGTYNSYLDTLQLAFTTPDDVELSLQQVREARSDLMYVRHGERSQAAMALLRLEAGQHKWVSADNALLIMQQGRIVRTVGFSNDLLYLTNTQADQLRQPEAINPAIEWLRLADWQNGEYGYALSSRFSVQPNQPLRYFGHSFNTTQITEQVSYVSPANYLRLDKQWQNTFWFDSQTGTLLKSVQQLAPFAERFEMTYISRIARLIPADAVTADAGGDSE